MGSLEVVKGQHNTSSNWLSKCKVNLYLSPMVTKLQNNAYSSEMKGKAGFSGGANLVYYFKNGSKIKLGLSIGVDYSAYHTTYNLYYNDSVWTSDVDGDRVHIYEQGNVSETQKASYIIVPLQFHMEYSLSGKWQMYFNPGVFLSFASWGRYTSNSVLSRQGYYPFYNLLISDMDIDQSQYFYPTNKSLSSNEQLKLKNCTGLVGSTGVRYNLDSKFVFFTGIKTYFGLNNISGYKNSNTMMVANSDRSLNTLMSRGDKIKTISYGLEFGITISIN